jgi:hypothetical protein
MTKHISKITERYFNMAYSKHKMTEYHGDGGLGTAARGVRGLVNAGSAHRSMRDESEAHADARVDGERAGRWSTHRHGVGGARTGLVGSVRWLAGLDDELIGRSPR